MRSMRTRRFGSLPIEVPVIGIGTWNMERDDPKQAVAAIRRALELGMTHVDTAELYGNGTVEKLVGEAIAGQRDRIFLTSKVLPKHGAFEAVLRACEASLQRLGTDHLDLYLLHWRGDVPLAETFRAFEQLRERGKIGAWGVSNFDDADLEEALATAPPGRIACNQVLYHLRERTIEHRITPWCAKHGAALVGYSPFGSRGRWAASPVLDAIAKRLDATPRQIALAFLTRNPVAFAIPKSAQPAHVDELAGADRVVLDDAALAELEAAFPLPRWRGLPTL
jgi:diketogulonate reductase-like aldo/keto reductase